MKNKKISKIRSIMIATILILVYLGSMSFVQAAPGDVNIKWQEPGKSPGNYIAVTIGDSFRYDLHFDLENMSQAWQAQSSYVNVEFRPAGIINYTSAAKGELTYDATVWIVPNSENYSNVEGWFRNLAGSFNELNMNNTAGTVANVTWYANKVGVATIYHNASRTSYGGTAGDMNSLRTNGEVRVHPQSPSDFAIEDEGPTWFNMSWGSALGIDKYVIFRSDVAQPTEPTGSPIYNNTGLTYNNTGLSIEKDYYYSMWGWNETEGFYSLDYETLTKESQDALPSTFTAETIDKSTIDLAWDIQGPMQQLILRPNADASPNQWTPSTGSDNYEMVNEETANDGTDYVYSSTTGHEDWYSLPTTIFEGIIESVTITVRARKEGSDSGVLLRTKTRVDSETSESGSITLSETWTTYQNTFTKNPDGDDWTFNDINDLDIGIKAQYVEVPINVTQIYATVNYRTVNAVIERSESSDPWNQGVGDEIYNGTGLYFRDEGLDPSTTYYYQLWTYVDGEYSSIYLQANNITSGNNIPVISNEDPIDTDTDVDKMYSQVSAQINDLDGDIMDWTIQGEYITNAGDTGVGNTTIYADLITPLPYDAVITWYVNITDGYDWSNETFSFTVRSEYAPAHPDDFEAEAYGRTQINLSWTKVTHGEYVIIERSSSSDPWSIGEGLQRYNNTGTYYEDIDLEDGATYYYQIWSYNVTDNVYSTTNATAWNVTDGNYAPNLESAKLHAEIYTSIYNTYLNVSVSDSDDDILDVTFYWSNHTVIAYKTDVEAGGYWNISIGDYFGPAWRQWLEHDVNYTWYVVIDDGFDIYNSSTEDGLFWFYTSKAFDINEDGTTDSNDISLLVINYGAEGYHPGELPADIMETGEVNVDDVSMFVSNYGWAHLEYPFE